MADRSKRTTILLTVVAILFILTIIILCLPFNLGHKNDPFKDKHGSDRTKPIQDTTTTTPSITPSTHSTVNVLKPISTTITPSITPSTHSTVNVSRSISTTITPSITPSTHSTVNVSQSTSTTSTSPPKWSTPSVITLINTTENMTETTPLVHTDSTGTSTISTSSSKWSTSSVITRLNTTENMTETTPLGHTDSTGTSSVTEDVTKTYLNVNSTEEETTTFVETEATTTPVSTTEETTTVVKTETTTTPVSTTSVSTTPVSTTPMVTTIDPFLDEPECNKKECKDFSAKMWVLRNTSALPCEDFYQYACGGVVDSPSLHPVDAGEAVKRKIRAKILNGSSDAYMLAKNFYSSCLHQDPVQARKQWRNTSAWMDLQIPPSNSSCGKDELTSMLAQLINNNFAPLFDVSLGLDNDGQFVTRVTPPILRYPFSDDIAQQYCLKQYKLGLLDESNIDVERKYEEYLNCTADGYGMEARLYYLELNLGELGIQDPLLTKTIDFFTKASKLKRDPFTSEDVLQLDYETLELNDIRISEQINWDTLLSDLFNTSNEVMQIQVYKREYITKINELLSQEHVCDILRTLWKESRYMDLVSPQSTLTPYSEEYCLDLTTSLLPELLYSIDEAQFTPDTPDTIDKVSESIWTMESFSEKNKEITAENKALQIFNQTKMVNNIFNIDGNHAEIMSSSSYQKKSLLLLKRFRSELYNQLSNHDQDHYLHMYRAFENAAFYPENKYFSGASYMLEAPYYTEEEPAYLSYPGLGAAMARTAIRNQQVHGTDSPCVIQEEFQGYKNSNVTLTVNLKKMEYLRKFSKMVWDGYNYGKYLVSENRTEHLGRRDFAPLSWLDSSPDKLFYLRSAQIHCEATSRLDLLAVKERGHIPGPIRVNAILMNEPGFLRAFSCPTPQPRMKTKDICNGQ